MLRTNGYPHINFASTYLKASPQFGWRKEDRKPLTKDVFTILNRPGLDIQNISKLKTERHKGLVDTLEAFKQDLDVPLDNDPPQRPVGLPNTKVILLPDDYQSQAIHKTTNILLLNVPTREAINTLTSNQPIDFEVPILSPEHFSVTNNDHAWMDLQADTQARQLVEGGKLPSMIGKGWKAVWGLEKTSRDILQNFFDGHNGTLEGIKIHISRDKTSGKFKVLITGQGEYDYEKAYLLGGTSKAQDTTKAGNYGEGLKVLSLNLLRDFGADSVRMSSANWQMTYSLPQEQVGQARIFRHLEVLNKPIKGNVLEFNTDKPELIEQLFKSLNYFYSPYNPDFSGLLVQSQHGGIAIYDDPNQKGNVYIARQRFAYEKEDHWEGSLKGLTVWSNGKSIDKGRDRTAVHESELKKTISNIISELSDEDLVSLLNLLKPYWNYKDDPKRYSAGVGNTARDYHKTIVDAVISNLHERKISTGFEDKYFTETFHIREDVKSHLKGFGYVFCPYSFHGIGMIDGKHWHKYFANFKMIEPSPHQKLRIQILHGLMVEFIKELEKRNNELIVADDNKKPIYVYNQEGRKGPDRLVQGRARFDAIWIGDNQLRQGLYEVFNVYAHELMHKYGDDGTEEFGYAYHRYIPVLINIMMGSPDFHRLFQEYKLLWDATVKEEYPEPPPTTPSESDGSDIKEEPIGFRDRIGKTEEFTKNFINNNPGNSFFMKDVYHDPS